MSPAVIGVIFGAVGTTRFHFSASDPSVKKGEYVQVQSGGAPVLGQIVELERESGGADARLAATVAVIGQRDQDGTLQVPRSPFTAGEMVYRAEDSLVASALGLTTSGACIGLLKGRNLPVHLEINTLVQKHACILAKTGGGKSYMVGVLLEELLKRGVPVVVFDPHGEYTSLMHPNTDARDQRVLAERYSMKPKGYAEQVVEFSPDERAGAQKLLRFDERNLEPRDLIELCNIRGTGPQVGIINRVVAELADEKEDYTLGDIIEKVKADRNSAKWGLINTLEYLQASGLFAPVPTRVSEMVREWQCSIINLRGVPPDVQEIVVTRICNRLFDGRKLDRIPPLMMVVEEAHNFCPQQSQAISSRVLRTVASEGRKFGLGLCVVTQRPAKVDKNVLSQCNTQIILKVTNPLDLKAIVQSIEGLTEGLEDEIQRLPIGVAIVTGVNMGLPVSVEIRPRESKHGGAGVEVVRKGEADGVESQDVMENGEEER